jgi:hypothetical protein
MSTAIWPAINSTIWRKRLSLSETLAQHCPGYAKNSASFLAAIQISGLILWLKVS